MQLFSGSVSEFVSGVTTGHLVSELKRQFKQQMLVAAGPSEISSWEASLRILADDLKKAEIPDAGVVLEYALPLTSKRTDVILFGGNALRQNQAIVIELKQWLQAEIEDVEGHVVIVAGRRLLHPQQQIAHYVEYIRDFHPMVDSGEIILDGIVYLHNARTNAVKILVAAERELTAFPIFSLDDRDQLREYLQERLSHLPGNEVMRRFLHTPLRPSKKLLEHVAQEIAGSEVFTLLDEQLHALEEVRNAVQDGLKKSRKQVVLVTGGPGTGKSVIAARILGEFAKQGLHVSHATGSKSFTETMRKRVGKRAGNLFRYFNSFGSANPDQIDVLVSDEAHRIRETSKRWGSRGPVANGLRQVDELIQVARVPVFLLDENQVVRPYEMGTVASIEEAARRHGARVRRVDLNGHFRAMGSEAYIEWVDRLLELTPGGPIRWEGSDPFQLVVANNPVSMEGWLQARIEEGFTARLSAGFCWPWSDPHDGRLVDDVVVGEWKRPWNAKPDKYSKDAPPASFWASDPRGFGQVGCIYTAQGFEYDYAGVIMGDDFVWRDGTWRADQAKHADPIVKRAANFRDLVRNVYKVLLTRGLRGCALLSTDSRTQDMLQSVILTRI